MTNHPHPLESGIPANVLDPEPLDMLGAIPEWGEASLRTAIQAFLEQTPILVQQLEKAQALHDTAALMRAAHTIKGSAVSLGLMRLTWIADRIVCDLRAQRSDRLSTLVQSLGGEMEPALAALKQRLVSRHGA